MTTSASHQRVKAQLCGFVVKDIILIIIDHCVLYLDCIVTTLKPLIQ